MNTIRTLISNIVPNNIILFNDAPTDWGWYFQDSASPSFEGIEELHDQIMFYLIIILFGVSYMLLSVIKTFNHNKTEIVHKYHNHGTLIELIWTISPALVLVSIAFPSFKLLYLMDDVFDPCMTIKVVGFLDGLKSYIFGKIIW
jgi:cytochrome c oxidase subunit 2